jgi:hypothetical protein
MSQPYELDFRSIGFMNAGIADPEVRKKNLVMWLGSEVTLL